MKSNIHKAMVLFLIAYSACFLFLFHQTSTRSYDTSPLILTSNEMYHEMKEGTLTESQLQSFQEEVRTIQDKQLILFDPLPYYLLFVVSIVFFLVIYAYLYRRILRPFQSLKAFASQVSRGNFDVPMQEQHAQVFGAFSWAFDNLRFELRKAKERETLAIQNTKTVIASLSHDIKTPIASIRACSEALQNGMANTPERKQRYLSTIIKKCDAVSALSDDLFLHALNDMEALQYHCEWKNPLSFFTELHEQILQEGDTRIQIHQESFPTAPSFLCYMDEQRTQQAIYNLLQNALKYTDGLITISYERNDAYLQCHIQDQGSGILDEDLPFIFEKFYRGKHVSSIAGAGLGLYLVKDMMEKMKGTITLTNTKPGLRATLAFLMKD